MNPFFAFCNTAFAGSLGLFADYERCGEENIPPHGPLLIIANHQSNMDPPVVARSITRRALFLAKKEVFANFVFAALLKWWGAHPVTRGGADLDAFRWILDLLAQPDGCVVMFPEGTRSPGKMREGLTGVASVALRSDVPVLPIGIWGTEVLGGIFRALNPTATIRVKIGTPFRVRDPGGRRREALRTLTTEMMGRVAALIPEPYRGVYTQAAVAPHCYTYEPGAQTPSTTQAAPDSTPQPFRK